MRVCYCGVLPFQVLSDVKQMNVEEIADKERKKGFSENATWVWVESELIVEVAELKEIQQKNTDNIFLAWQEVS